MADLNKDALTCVPLHVGFIMDGNGRWAKKRGLPRKAGHSQGAKVFRRTVEDCRDIGIKYCTFYAFSTENWKRPKDEVDAIMKLLVKYLDDIRSMAQKNTRISLRLMMIYRQGLSRLKKYQRIMTVCMFL